MKLEMKIDRLDQQLSEYSARLIRVEARFESLEKYIANIDKNVEKLLKFQEELETWKIKTHDNTREIGEMKSEMKEICDREDLQDHEIEKIGRLVLKWTTIATTIIGVVIFAVDHFVRR